MRERYVLLGLARPRADWFRRIGQWATSAVIPAEFVRCVSAEELRARLASSRPFSVLLIDGALPALDRDLVALAGERDVPVIVVDATGERDWRGIDAAGALGESFGRDELLEALAAHAQMVGGAVVEEAVGALDEHALVRGRLVAVTGPGGTGSSTAAIALAQGFANGEAGADVSARAEDRRGPRRDGGDEQRPPRVLLADLARVADQAMLHDSRVLVPGVQEVVEAHRTAVPSLDQLRDQTFDVPARGYRLLLGLRRARHWVAIRPRSLEVTLDSLQRLADVVVADVDSDVEGEAETGSVDVEERNLLARATFARADAVVVVGEPSMKGLYAQVRLIGELLGFGVPIDRVVPVSTQVVRNPRVRAELTTSFSELLAATVGAQQASPPAPTYLPERRVDEALRDGVALPKPLPQTLARAVGAVLARAGGRAEPEHADVPGRVAPGSLTTFTAQEHPQS